ncbi:MAG: hypothetical protein BMS9Abin19_1090 [Gammaproteobacteria bacterium]|nr:MAG: hypothetical protein BMS9Abin19_1090 [Gammaproteobacteria bacterium]
MEEDEYKSTYNELTSIRCVFEKALVNHQAKCRLSRHFCLADREGYSCDNKESSGRCCEFLEILRENSTFVLKLHEISGPLPHNMEIRVQAGGLMGLAKLVDVNAEGRSKQPVVDDINWILSEAQRKYGLLGNLPYSEINQSVVQFQGRRRRKS